LWEVCRKELFVEEGMAGEWPILLLEFSLNVLKRAEYII
jgi:hypothetical protein